MGLLVYFDEANWGERLQRGNPVILMIASGYIFAIKSPAKTGRQDITARDYFE
ncbi:MAG: hypothetical protein V3T58_03540 [Candidatus Hydrothermarchaeales archaeon]